MPTENIYDLYRTDQKGKIFLEERSIPVAGLLFSLASWIVLSVYLYRTDLNGLAWIGTFYLSVIVAELGFSKRGLLFGR
jgi:hypothetical protein